MIFAPGSAKIQGVRELCERFMYGKIFIIRRKWSDSSVAQNWKFLFCHAVYFSMSAISLLDTLYSTCRRVPPKRNLFYYTEYRIFKRQLSCSPCFSVSRPVTAFGRTGNHHIDLPPTLTRSPLSPLHLLWQLFTNPSLVLCFRYTPPLFFCAEHKIMTPFQSWNSAHFSTCF
jgi:hypothetical protein